MNSKNSKNRRFVLSERLIGDVAGLRNKTST